MGIRTRSFRRTRLVGQTLSRLLVPISRVAIPSPACDDRGAARNANGSGPNGPLSPGSKFAASHTFANANWHWSRHREHGSDARDTIGDIRKPGGDAAGNGSAVPAGSVSPVAASSGNTTSPTRAPSPPTKHASISAGLELVHRARVSGLTCPTHGRYGRLGRRSCRARRCSDASINSSPHAARAAAALLLGRHCCLVTCRVVTSAAPRRPRPARDGVNAIAAACCVLEPSGSDRARRSLRPRGRAAAAWPARCPGADVSPCLALRAPSPATAHPTTSSA